MKLRVHDLRHLRRALLRLGFRESVSRSFEDNWIFDFPDRRLTQADSLLRLRYYQGRAILTFKGPASRSRHFKIREELETEVQSPDVYQEILCRLGLQATFRYQKYRSVFKSQGPPDFPSLTVTLDETPIGDYAEIEGAEKEIDSLAKKLGFSRGQYITDSYLVLYLKERPRSRKKEMVFRERSEKNL